MPPSTRRWSVAKRPPSPFWLKPKSRRPVTGGAAPRQGRKHPGKSRLSGAALVARGIASAEYDTVSKPTSLICADLNRTENSAMAVKKREWTNKDRSKGVAYQVGYNDSKGKWRTKSFDRKKDARA